jgi:putative salt-induced outer membrane protein
MKLLKTVPAAALLAGAFASAHAMADDSVFTVMDDPSTAKKPFEGAVNAGYLAQSGNTKSSSMTADSTLTWYGDTTAWSLWGMPATRRPTISAPPKNTRLADVAATT